MNDHTISSKICPVCGKEFTDTPKHLAKRKTCSRRCSVVLTYPAPDPVYVPGTNTYRIPLPHGKFAVVDANDVDLAEFAWSVEVGTTGILYAVRNAYSSSGAKRQIKMHRVILERIESRDLESTDLVDHVNLNGLDNRRENLRLATKSQNGANRTLNAANTTGYKGVQAHPSGRWRAQISANGRKIHLGYFATPEEAHAAYAKAAREHFGDFANDGRD